MPQTSCCYVESSQPQRITPGLKQILICLLLTLHTSHQTTNYLSPIDSSHKSSNHKLPQNTKSVLTQIYIYNKRYTDIEHNIFEELVPSVLPLLKKHVRLGHASIVNHSVNLSIPDFFF